VFAKQHDVIVVDYDMVTAFGKDAQMSWDALMAGRRGLAPDARFYPADAGKCYPVGVAASADSEGVAGRSRFMRVMAPLLPTMGCVVPQDAKLILATTVGEIDLLEEEVAHGRARPPGAPQETCSCGALGERALPLLAFEWRGLSVTLPACAEHCGLNVPKKNS